MGRNNLSWIEWNPTMLCQAALVNKQPIVKGQYRGCTYCYAAEGMPHDWESAAKYKRDELTTKQAINFLNKVSRMGVPRLSILGGEPQIRKDFDLIIQHACRVIPLVSMSTNSVGTRKHIGTLIKVPMLDISLDSHIREIGYKTRPPLVVDCAISGIELLKEHPFLCLNTVVTPFNIERLLEFIEWAWEKGIKRVNLYPLLGNTHQDKNIKLSKQQALELYTKLKERYPFFYQNYCKSGKHLVVNYDGEILYCAAHLGQKSSRKTIDDLERIAQDQTMKEFGQYDFAAVAPADILASSGCPGKELFDSQWIRPNVPKKKNEDEGDEKYCMRCNAKADKTNTCRYCGFELFDNKPITMTCTAFSVYNPTVFAGAFS